jgi:hypothetical protein
MTIKKSQNNKPLAHPIIVWYTAREDEGELLKTVDTHCFATREEPATNALRRRCPNPPLLLTAGDKLVAVNLFPDLITGI